MALTLTQILCALPALKPSELAAVKAAAERLEGNVPSDHSTDPLYPVYVALLKLLNGGPNYGQFLRSKSGKLWRINCPKFLTFMSTYFKEASSNRTLEDAVTGYLLGLIHDSLRGVGATVTVGVLTANLHRTPAIFEDAFPGYLENNMTHFLLNKMRPK